MALSDEEVYERAKAARDAADKRIIDNVKRAIVEQLNLWLVGTSTKKERIKAILERRLHDFVVRGVIMQSSLEVDIVSDQRIKHVNYLPVTAVPGDALIRTEHASEGRDVARETYKGIIISSDGAGNGILFQNMNMNTMLEVHVRCCIMLRTTPEYVLIEIRHEI